VDLVDLRPDRIFNYDMFELFYWEHRMGSWQSLQIMDLDVAQDTFILYNNRHILRKMLSVPLEDRLWNRIHLEIIRSRWPELLDILFRTDLKPWHRKVPRNFAMKVKYPIEQRLSRHFEQSSLRRTQTPGDGLPSRGRGRQDTSQPGP
jgi:hypothetical protein